MGLNEYKKKRNFAETAEPDTGEKKSEDKLKFVVQRHHASRLHYDFRLEMEGVLKSWAVPKGPSLNPKDKRLAMMVEDHPYDYRTFEGVIPEGNYGAGVVTIFDEGTYESLEDKGEADLKSGLYNGNLKFRLHGHILKGEFALVKLKNAEENSWLLIKHRDEYAVDKNFDSENLVPAKVKKSGLEHKKLAHDAKVKIEKINVKEDPEFAENEITYKPMLAKPISEIFDDEDWIYEKKLDGYRALAYIGKKVKLVSRNGLDFTAKYAVISSALSKLKNEAVIDGELVAEDENGKAIFQDIQNFNRGNKNIKLKYYAFDLLALNGHDIRGLELLKRKKLLKTLLSNIKTPEIVFNEHVVAAGKKLLDEATAHEWEGIMAKKATSTYESNKRSGKWLKIKFQNTQEAIIIGYSKPVGSRNYFASLVLAMYEDRKLVYIGNCGTGFNEETLKDVFNQMKGLETDKKPIDKKVKQERSITWIKPNLVCDVSYAEWTADKQLRHPVFKGLRPDKKPEEIEQELPQAKKVKTANSSSGQSKSTSAAKKMNEREEKFGNKTVKFTNLNKLYWKNEKISKSDLIEYYRSISEYILPFLKDRPLSLNRHPNGIDGPNFFQKDLDTQQIPSWVKYQPMYSESNDKNIDYLICNDLPTLLWMANLGCIEINPWLSTFKKPENPVFGVMDLDPNDVDDFSEVVHVAFTAKEILEQMGIKAYIKTSGSRGLHIFIHVGGKYDYELIKNFINYLGKLILERHPETTSLERSPAKRKKKIYLDFLQNRRGQTIAAPYSVRPKTGATVSTPLNWDEVNDSLNIKQFTIFNTLNRIKDKGELWKDITKEKADLKQALERMNKSS